MQISLERETRMHTGSVALRRSGVSNVIRLLYGRLTLAWGFVGYGGAGPPIRIADLFAYSLPRLVSRRLLKATAAQTAEAGR